MGLISISVILYVLFSLSEGIKKNVIDKYLQTIPVNEIIVSKKSFVMNIPVLSNFSFNSNANITDTTLTEISAIAGIKKIYPVLNINFPVSIYIDLFNYKFQSDLAVTGIPAELIEEDQLKLSRPFKFDSKADKDIPALISFNIVDFYNSNFAEANKLPKFSYKSIIGRHFTLLFGQTSLKQTTGKTKNIRCQISGLSKRADLLGLTVPIETVMELNKWYSPDYQPSYASIILKTDNIKDMPVISEKIKNMGYNVYSLNEIIDKINSVSFGAIAIVMIVIVTISAAVVFNIFNYYMTLIKSQESDIRILRLIGFSIANIRKIYIYQSLLITAAAIFISITTARFIVSRADILISKKIFELTKADISLFASPVWIDASLAGSAIIITAITVFLAIRKHI